AGGVTAAGAGLGSLFNPTRAYAATAAEKQAEADEVKRKMDIWDSELARTANDYNDAMDANDLAVSKMDDAQAEIDAASARQAGLQAQLGARATAMYKDGPLGFLDVALGASSFTQFSTTWSLIEDINKNDAKLIAESKQARADAQAAHDEYATQEQIAQQKLNEAADAKAQAEQVMKDYQAQLDSLEAEVAALIEAERQAELERQRILEEQRQAALAAANGGSGSGSGSGSSGSGGSSGGAARGYVPYDGSKYGSVVAAAMSRLGCPYVWAANGPNSFDCSGLTSWCYRTELGKSIPRGGNAQYLSAPMQLPVSEAQPGDILYKPGHVGIYIGGGQFIHAPRPGDVVKVSTVAGYGWVGAARW
ncbi:MAG: NlpC/P60 family protein, partial [Coriobacteriia bacterium]|nr:NlpC/P60 family protein [Coriobacteriia bacterium]